MIVLDHLTPAQRRAYLLADNKLAELAGWDEDLLRLELKELELEEFDLGVIGFSDEELPREGIPRRPLGHDRRQQCSRSAFHGGPLLPVSETAVITPPNMDGASSIKCINATEDLLYRESCPALLTRNVDRSLHRASEHRRTNGARSRGPSIRLGPERDRS